MLNCERNVRCTFRGRSVWRCEKQGGLPLEFKLNVAVNTNNIFFLDCIYLLFEREEGREKERERKINV